jgi:hypothetical protein
MALQDLQQQIVQLPIHDRWLLVQTLLDSIQRDTHTNANASPSLASQPSDVSNEAVLDDLHPWTKSFIGIAKQPSNDSQEAYIDYLEKKYA